MILRTTRPGDGCYLAPGVHDIERQQRIDWIGLLKALFRPDESMTTFELNVRFKNCLDPMTNEDRFWVWQAYHKFDGGYPARLTFAERMALARVCRRIIREAKERKTNGI